MVPVWSIGEGASVFALMNAHSGSRSVPGRWSWVQAIHTAEESRRHKCSQGSTVRADGMPVHTHNIVRTCLRTHNIVRCVSNARIGLTGSVNAQQPISPWL